MTASWWPWIAVSSVWVFAIVMMVMAVLLEPEDFRPVLVEVCDDAVRTLLNTHDIVELERSKFLITKLRCRVGSRL
jgi:hypothetical protein